MANDKLSPPLFSLKVCCGSVTDAGKVALRQQRGGTDNKTGPVQEGGGRGGGDCPSCECVSVPHTAEKVLSVQTYYFSQ